MKVVFIIPARGGSKRLHRKNLYLINGKPCIQYAIESCLKSKYAKNNVYVTSEDVEILSVSKDLGANIISRPASLSEDHVWTQDVLIHASDYLNFVDFDYIVRVQANSPQVTSKKIDECIDKLIKYNLWEVFTVDQNGIEDAAVHVMKASCVYQKALSVYKGVVFTNYIDIHTVEDVEKVEIQLSKAGQKQIWI
jgi:CMP-N,N'-diacetyllegionaminic acid synthase